MDPPARSATAPYGRSCEECSKSKCRCVLPAEGGSCERCARIGRACRPASSKRRRRVDKARGEPSRVEEAVNKTAELERKLNTLLASIQRGSLPGELPRPPPLSTLPLLETPPRTTGLQSPSNSNTHQEPETTTLHELAQLSPQEAEECLVTFRRHYVEWFPVVHLPLHVSAQQLYEERPVLWLSIMVICARTASARLRLDHLFRQTVAEEMVVKSAKSVDLLLGLLVFIGWYHVSCHRPNGEMRLSMSLMTQMAVSLVYDLRKPLNNHPYQALKALMHKQQAQGQETRPVPSIRTLEEKRAVIGCFFITSTTSVQLQKTDALRWTSDMEGFLQEIAERPEWTGDEVLVRLVRIQLVVERASLLSWFDNTVEPTARATAPPSFYVHTLLAQLEAVRASLGPRLVDDYLLRLMLYSTELGIVDSALYTPTPTPQSEQHSLQRRKLRFASLSYAKAWYEVFLSMPPIALLGMSFFASSQAFQCLGTLLHLSTTSEPGWSREDVPSEVDVPRIIDRTMNILERAATELDLGDDHILRRHCHVYRMMSPSWLAKLSSGETTGEAAPLPTPYTSVNQPVEINDTVWNQLFDLSSFDSEWLLG